MLKVKNEGQDGDAEALAIRALGFLAQDPVHLKRFLDLSGLEAHQLRSQAKEPGFFAGLLDYLLAHEPTLTAFATEAGTSPEAVVAARAALGGDYREAPR